MTFPNDHYSRSSTPSGRPSIHIQDEYEDSVGSDVEDDASGLRTLTTRAPFVASTSSPSNLNLTQNQNLLYPHSNDYVRENNASPCSTASATPVPSRSPSPGPLYLPSSSSSSDEDEDGEYPYLLDSLSRRASSSSWRERPRWWQVGGARRRRRRETISWFRSMKRIFRRLIRHPFVPKTPLTIILTLLLLSAFGVSLTFLLIYILNPDKEPLPWRGYCTIPQLSETPPSPSLPPTASFPYFPPSNFTPPSFPPDDFDTLSPAGVFVGVFSIDTGVERRMLVRSTWASHARSRNGAGEGDGGLGTSRTIIRFILGQPRKDWERRIQLEMDTYNDMIILPVSENMNSGKSHSFFTWASANAWVPPLYSTDFPSVPSNLTYANQTTAPPPLAKHDSLWAHKDRESENPMPWVRPDFVMKADDDAFVMLAELEARLRVALHAKPDDPTQAHVIAERADAQESASIPHAPLDPLSAEASHPVTSLSNTTLSPPPLSEISAANYSDPLIYWGYRVKNRFMAGELYGLSFALVQWIAQESQLKGLTRGAEDKQTSKWMRLHPRASEVRWVSERCWIYDHPRAATVYSHGFLFPSEVKRVQRDVLFDLEHNALHSNATPDKSSTVVSSSPFGPYGVVPPTWSRSTVSTFGVRYSLPIPDLTTDQSIEALVEGSEMSRLREGTSSPGTIDHAWRHREGRSKRYDGKRLGGTVAVHFIKKNMWFLETALALLEGDDVTEVEWAKAIEDSRPSKKAVPLDSHSWIDNTDGVDVGDP